MPIGTIFVILIVLGVAYWMVSAPQRRVTNSANKADSYLALGEQALLVGDLDRAYGNFQTARLAADQARHPLWQAEACYGLARVADKRGDYAQAHHYVTQALTYEPQLRDGFQPYLGLLKRAQQEWASKL